MKWVSAPLSEVAALERNSISPADIKSGSRYVGLDHIEAGGGSIRFGSVANGELASNKFQFGPNHILFGKLRPYLAKVVCPDFEGICSTDIIPIAPSKHVDKRYLLHFLRRPETITWAAGRATGVNLPRLSPKELASLEVPLPPLDEQRRIAAILDKADALRHKRRRTLELADQLAQSLFNSRHQASRESWTEIRFADFAQKGSGNFGNGPFGSDLLTSELTTEGVPVVYIRDIVTEKYKRVSQSFVTKRKAAQLAACSVKGGDLLITKVGDPPGVAAVYPYDEPNAIMTQDVIRLRTNRLLAIPEYLAFLLNSSEGRHLISGITVAATRARFSLRDLKTLIVSVPSLEAQRAFLTAIKALHNVSAGQVASEATIKSLFSSLQHRAFSGEL